MDEITVDMLYKLLDKPVDEQEQAIEALARLGECSAVDEVAKWTRTRLLEDG